MKIQIKKWMKPTFDPREAGVPVEALEALLPADLGMITMTTTMMAMVGPQVGVFLLPLEVGAFPPHVAFLPLEEGPEEEGDSHHTEAEEAGGTMMTTMKWGATTGGDLEAMGLPMVGVAQWE